MGACTRPRSGQAPKVRTGLATQLLLCISLGSAACSAASESSVSGPAPSPSPSPKTDPRPSLLEFAKPAPQPGTFEGRELAQTMSHLGAPWLTRTERDAEENTTLLHEQLALAPGQVACDLGAGNGYHTLLMAEAVGEQGQVIASDLQPQMLELLRERASSAGLRNIQTVLASPGSPALPTGGCDLILLVDVYHEFAEPERMLAAMRAALSERGRIALVEYREEDPEVPIKALHKMSKQQILREYLPRGFRLVEEFDGLPWQHLMFFAAS